MSIIDPIRTRVDLATLDLGFSAFPNVQPFSPRAAVGYQDLLEGLYRYVTRDIYTFLQANAGQATWDNNVDALLAAVDGVLAQQKSDIDTDTANALQQVIDATIAVTDPVTLAIVNNATAATRLKLDALYLHATASAKNGLTGWWHVDDYGAKGDGTTHDDASIQHAIDAATAVYAATGIKQRVFFAPKTYLVGANDTGGGVMAGIVLKSGVELYGPDAVVKTAPGAYWIGTQWAAIRSLSTGVTDVAIRELTVDGNRSAYSVPGGNIQAMGIYLSTVTNCRIVGVSVRHCDGVGLMVAGPTSAQSSNITIQDCHVTDTGSIGIQCSQFDGLNIINNRITSTGDNAIDIYGENGTTTAHAYNFTVEGNHIKQSTTGIFLETVSGGIVQGNRIQNSATGDGVHVNRINGQPNTILITGNWVVGGNSGVNCTGDTGGVTIRNNMFEAFNVAGVQLGGAGNVSGYYILDNEMNGNSDSIPRVLIKSGTNQAANIVHMRTMTRSRDRSTDWVNYCTNNANLTHGAAISPGDTIGTIES